jgi:RNA recognition motif-containing protein
MASDSEDGHAAPKEEVDAVPAPAGKVILDEVKEPTKPKDEPKDEFVGSSKPSFTLYMKNVPEDLDQSELEMRLIRHGEVVSIEKADKIYIVKFSRTKEAYAAREKLNGYELNGSTLQVDFGPQDAEHYARKGQKRQQDRGRKEFPDAEGEHAAEVAPPPPRKGGGRGMRAWDGARDEPVAKRQRMERADGTQKDAGERALGSLTAPAKPMSRWSDKLEFAQQLEDFMKMPRRGMYNRYLVIGKLPPELRTSEAIWRMVAPVQRDIVQVEMLTCFGKPVAHVALRNATSAATMHRLAEQMLPNLTVAFAPPRRASPTLWLGNIDDYVPRKDLEGLLETFGEVAKPGFRYVPSRTCAFITFMEVEDAVSARNTLYGMEVLKNQYLNVDFTDEIIENLPPEGFGMWGQGQYGRGAWMPPWVAADPRAASWGMYGSFYDKKGEASRRSPQRGRSRDKGKRRERSRTPTKKQATSPERGRRRARQESPQAQRKSSSPEAPEVPKAKVKLYKMGEFCCNIVANFVKGNQAPESIGKKLQIDQRTKIDHCRSHMERAGELCTVWHFSAADRKDCGAYDALCDYFVDKLRVGLVQTPTHYVYIVPPTDAYLKELNLPSSNFVVGIQIPIKK